MTKISLYRPSTWASWPSSRVSTLSAIENFRAACRRDRGGKARDRRGTGQRGRDAARQRGLNDDQCASRQASPAAPSVNVMARVPMVGMRKNVVPSVPTMLPAVDIA